jgi:ribosomal protein L12E/L44/L45/RPP1/RPP2
MGTAHGGHRAGQGRDPRRLEVPQPIAVPTPEPARGRVLQRKPTAFPAYLGPPDDIGPAGVPGRVSVGVNPDDLDNTYILVYIDEHDYNDLVDVVSTRRNFAFLLAPAPRASAIPPPPVYNAAAAAAAFDKHNNIRGAVGTSNPAAPATYPPDVDWYPAKLNIANLKIEPTRDSRNGIDVYAVKHSAYASTASRAQCIRARQDFVARAHNKVELQEVLNFFLTNTANAAAASSTTASAAMLVASESESDPEEQQRKPEKRKRSRIPSEDDDSMHTIPWDAGEPYDNPPASHYYGKYLDDIADPYVFHPPSPPRARKSGTRTEIENGVVVVILESEDEQGEDASFSEWYVNPLSPPLRVQNSHTPASYADRYAADLVVLNKYENPEPACNNPFLPAYLFPISCESRIVLYYVTPRSNTYMWYLLKRKPLAVDALCFE